MYIMITGKSHTNLNRISIITGWLISRIPLVIKKITAIGNTRKLDKKYIEIVSAISKAFEQIASWHTKKNKVVLRLNNLKQAYSDSQNMTNPAPHIAETNL
jgi:hypothetical protein